MEKPQPRACPNRSKDLLQLEHNDPHSALGVRLSSICDANHSSSVKSHVSDLKKGPITESSVLSRVKAFLPVIAEANQKLSSAVQKQGAEEFNIEVLSGEESTPYIEMDLALGVADLHTPEAIKAADQLANGQAPDEFSVKPEDTDDSDNDSLNGVSLKPEDTDDSDIDEWRANGREGGSKSPTLKDQGSGDFQRKKSSDSSLKRAKIEQL